MSTEDNKADVRRGYEEGFHQRNLTVFDELMAPDYVWHIPSMTIQGRESAKQLIWRLLTAFPDGRFTIEDMIAEGDRVVVRQTFRGTHQGDFMGIPPTGKQVTATGIEIFRVANGKGVENWTNENGLGLLQQLGGVPFSGTTRTEALRWAREQGDFCGTPRVVARQFLTPPNQMEASETDFH